ncbi:MAG: preprotein translocase subunit SecE [Chloroflexota bacterium]|nr:preprotein translocase subunit SecE [Anaerolineae bacterium]
MAKKKSRAKKDNPVVAYLKQTQGEIRKVHWPSRKEAMNLTGVVLAVTITMSIFLSGMDYLFAQLVRLILS